MSCLWLLQPQPHLPLEVILHQSRPSPVTPPWEAVLRSPLPTAAFIRARSLGLRSGKAGHAHRRQTPWLSGCLESRARPKDLVAGKVLPRSGKGQIGLEKPHRFLSGSLLWAAGAMPPASEEPTEGAQGSSQGGGGGFYLLTPFLLLEAAPGALWLGKPPNPRKAEPGSTGGGARQSAQTVPRPSHPTAALQWEGCPWHAVRGLSGQRGEF